MDNIITDLQPKFIELVLKKAIAKEKFGGEIKVTTVGRNRDEIKIEITKTGSILNYHLMKLLKGEEIAGYECAYFAYTVGKAIVTSATMMLSDYYIDESISRQMQLNDDKDMYLVRSYGHDSGGQAIAVTTLENVMGFFISKLS